MAYKIGPKIGIDGEAEYKKQIGNIIAQGKTLKAEMDAVAKGFRAAGDESSDFEKKSDLLNRQIKNQNELVEKLQDMMRKSAEATGENSDETYAYQQKVFQAQGTLAEMEAALKELTDSTGELSEEQEGAGDSTEDLSKGLDDTAGSAENADKKTNVFVETLKSQLTAKAIVEGIKAIGDAFRDAAEGIKEAITGTVQWADDLATLSVQTGISQKDLQKMEYMAGLVDVDVSTITGSMMKLTRSMASASDGTGTAADAFKDLGINIFDAEGNLKSNQDVFYQVIDALGEIENPTERDAKAMELFGKSAQELNPMIKAGGDELKKFGDEAESTGYILSDNSVESLTKVSDAFERLQNAGENAKRNAIAALAPAILQMTAIAVPAMQEFAQNFSAMFNGDMTVGDFVTYLMTQIENVVNWISENTETIMNVGTQIIISIINGIAQGDIIGQAITIITTFIDAISQNLPLLLEAGIQAVMSMIEGLTSPDSIGSLVESGINLIISLTRGLIEAIPTIVQSIPTIIQNLVVALTENLPMLIVAGMELTMALLEGLITALPDLLAMLPEVGYRIVEAFGKVDWASIGTNIVNGILGGLSSMWNTLVNKAKEMASKVLSTVKGALGIHSPSRVFRDQVGKMIPAGLEQGVDRGMPAVLKDMQDQMDDLVIGASATINGASPVMSTGGNVSNSYGGFVINVNAQDGQSAKDIADEVMYRIQNAVARREAVFA